MRALILALSLTASVAAGARGDRLAIEASTVHLGDGRVVRDAVVLVEDGIVRAVGPRSRVTPPRGWPLERHETLLPGLVVAGMAPSLGHDEVSVGADRLAIDLVDPTDPLLDEWLAEGVTSLAVGTAASRLVGGRGGVVRVTREPTQRHHVRLGPLHASLVRDALRPPELFEPVAPVHVDRPLPPARPQRPHSAAGAVGELRRLLRAGADGDGPAVFHRVARGEVPLRVRAESEPEIRRALSLADEHDVRLIVEGAAEAWKLAHELADAGVTVVLAVPEAGLAASRPADVEERADAAALLAGAGVPIALTSREWLAGRWDAPTSPLLLAAAAVRGGLAPEDAIAAVTGTAARAAGAPDVGVIRTGARADLAAFDAPPLSLRARPTRVLVGGLAVRGDDADREAVLVVRAGRLHAAGVVHRDAQLVARADRVASVGARNSAIPAGAEVRDFGPEAVAVPGFVDAHSHLGLEPGRPAPGGSRVHALDAVDQPDHLARALDAGITAALVAPHARGPVRGVAALLSTGEPADADEADDGLVVFAGEAGMVFFVDDGPGDEGARSQSIAALRRTLTGARRYHDSWEKKEEAGEAPERDRPPSPDRHPPGRRRGGAAEEPEKEEPEKKPELEPYRALFQGQARAYLRAGRADTILPALDAFKAVELTPVLVGGEEADVVAAALAERQVTVVLGPQVLRREAGSLVNVAAALRAEGVPVAFGSLGRGQPELLPLAASRAVRHGLAADDALAALTTTAAAAIGGDHGLGSLAPGARADLVVFDGDPLEPASRVLAVVVGGRILRAWGGSDAVAVGR